MRINLQKRNFPIEYTQYENVNHYSTSYEILLPEGRKFVEIPESVVYNFKSHKYAINYKLISEDKLMVEIISDTDIANNISINEYNEFRSYVSKVIEAKESFIGFK